ncbi:MAG TPA: hypothetical protein PK349_01530 [Candidatus Hydrogenedentes bacterium]|nr:hypothetical protein [Candidatus Hydrogenedentota bacterium]
MIRMPGLYKPRRVVMVLVMGALVFSGCGTLRARPSTGDETVISPGTRVPFSPVQAGAPLQWESGPYPALFSPESWVAWAGPESDAPSPEWAAALTLPGDRFAVLECRLKSGFADQSIAYDAVGLRGVDVWLETPDGRQVFPVQVIRDGRLDEQFDGALRVFTRRCLLVFPREELYFVVDRETAAVQEMRLCLRVAQTVFSCRWPAQTPLVNTPLSIHEHPATQAVREELRRVWDKSKEVSHQFD